MPELFCAVKQGQWSLSVWSKDISDARMQLKRTLSLRDPQSGGKCLTEMRISSSLAEAQFYALPESGSQEYLDEDEELTEKSRFLEFDRMPPLFFENRDYQFVFTFEKAVKRAQIIHPLASVTDSFHLHNKKRLFSGNINFGNNIGWFHLLLQYRIDGSLYEDRISFQVLPVKMDFQKDLESILCIIDETYPLWRFSFAQKTDEELGRSRKPHERFFLLWLAQFNSHCDSLVKAVKLITRQPHTRLLPEERVVRAEKIRGRLSHALEERIVENNRAGLNHLKYRITRQTLQVDTPENRFVKMVLQKTVTNLTKLISISASDKRLSTVFRESMKKQILPFQAFLSSPLFRQVGDFEGLDSESLVLHHRLGYARIYRIWQDLKMYLDLFGKHASISMKTISELYEVWCFLEIRRLLMELGFEPKNNRKPCLVLDGLELELKNGAGAAFVLEKDGITIDLSHEPVFDNKKNPAFERIFTYTVRQKPDILLRAAFPDGRKLYWIFDAKYRIDTDWVGNEDRVPEDAINQMHRYRDALVHLNRSETKERPIIGAYALYPGFFEEEGKTNPYSDGIEEVGIGAFPLLPGQKNLWLKQFLKNTFVSDSGYNTTHSDVLLLSESSRIPTLYMSTYLYDDLTLIAVLSDDRMKKYIDAFHNGEAHWYHVPVRTLKKKYNNNAIRELKYIAPVLKKSSEYSVPFIYEIKCANQVMRNTISEKQAGTHVSNNPEEMYWLFELGNPQKIDSSIEWNSNVRRSFQYCFARKSDLLEIPEWNELREKYAGVFK